MMSLLWYTPRHPSPRHAWHACAGFKAARGPLCPLCFWGPCCGAQEGLSRAERRALRRQAAQEAGETAQRQAVLRGRGRMGGGGSEGQEGEEEEVGASWGFQEDAEQEAEEEEEDEEELTWQKFRGELTEHQKKLREKLQKRLEKVSKLSPWTQDSGQTLELTAPPCTATGTPQGRVWPIPKPELVPQRVVPPTCPPASLPCLCCSLWHVPCRLGTCSGRWK